MPSDLNNPENPDPPAKAPEGGTYNPATQEFSGPVVETTQGQRYEDVENVIINSDGSIKSGGQAKGYDITATTATPEIVLVGFTISFNLLMSFGFAFNNISISVGIFPNLYFLHNLVFNLVNCFFDNFFFFKIEIISWKYSFVIKIS